MIFNIIKGKIILNILTKTCYLFAQKKTVSIPAQKAILATQVIQFIAGSKFNPSPGNMYPSIAEQLQKIDLTKYVLQDQAKNEVLNIFKNGISINKQIYRQSKTFKEEGKFLFFPNYSLTGIIFAKLINPQSQMQITGPYGIGKSISLIMFFHLSSFIHHYCYLAKSSSKIGKEYESLKKEKAIFYPRKYWYWNIEDMQETKYSKKGKDSPINFKKNIINQATEVSQMDRLKLKNCRSHRQLKLQIQNIYHPNTQHIVIIDQIEVVTSYIRNWNCFFLDNCSALAQLQRKLKLDPNLINDPKIAQIIALADANEKKYFLPAIQIKKQLAKYIRFTPRQFINISSFSFQIQEELLSGQKLTPLRYMHLFRKYKPLSLYLCSRDYLPKTTNIRDRQLLKREVIKYDFWIFFWFEISRRIQSWSSQEHKEKTKQFFMKKVLTLTFKTNYRCIYIRQFCEEKKKNIQCIKPTLNPEQIAQYLFKDIVSLFQNYCLHKHREKMQNFLEGDDKQIKQKLIRACVVYAEDLVKNGLARFNLQINNFKQIIKANIILEKYFLSYDQNKHFILFEYDSIQSKASLLLTPLEFLEIAREFAYPCLSSKFMSALKKYQTLSDSFKGITIENFIKYLIQPSSVLNFFLPKCEIIADTKKETEWENIRIQISNKMGFNPFNEFSKDDNVEQNLSQILSWCKENPQKWSSGVPCLVEVNNIHKSQNENKLNHLNYPRKNVVINFLLAKYEKPSTISPKGKYTIYTFDVTVSINKNDILDDARTFITNLTHSLMVSNRSDIEISHVIFSPYIQLKIKQNINGIGNLYLCSIDQLEILNLNFAEDVKSYQQARQFMISIREQQSPSVKRANTTKRQEHLQKSIRYQAEDRK